MVANGGADAASDALVHALLAPHHPLRDPDVPRPAPVLIYDGACGVCGTLVRFVLKRDRLRRSLRFAPLDGPFAHSLRHAHPSLIDEDSVIWIEPGVAGAKVHLRSTAVLATLEYLGGGWKAVAWMVRWIPRAVRDRAYMVFARRRLFFSKAAGLSCARPDSETRERFLD